MYLFQGDHESGLFWLLSESIEKDLKREDIKDVLRECVRELFWERHHYILFCNIKYCTYDKSKSTWGSLSTTSILKPSITLCINQKATEHPIAPPPTTIISYWASKPSIKNKSITGLVFFQTPIHSFWIPPCAKPFGENHFYFIERGIFASNCKFSNKNDLLCIWRDFKNKIVMDIDIINEQL